MLCCASFVSFSLFTFIRYLHSHLPTYQCQSRFTNTETRPSNTLNDNPRHYRPPYYIFPRSFQLSHYFCSFCLICCWSVISCIAPPQVTASPKKSTPQPLLTACLPALAPPLLAYCLRSKFPSDPLLPAVAAWLPSLTDDRPPLPRELNSNDRDPQLSFYFDQPNPTSYTWICH